MAPQPHVHRPTHAYVAPPSIRHEIGVMLGFIGFIAISIALYAWAHAKHMARTQRREEARIERLRANGLLRRDEKLRKVDSGVGVNLSSTWTSGFGVSKREFTQC